MEELDKIIGSLPIIKRDFERQNVMDGIRYKTSTKVNISVDVFEDEIHVQCFYFEFHSDRKIKKDDFLKIEDKNTLIKLCIQDGCDFIAENIKKPIFLLPFINRNK